LAFTGFNFAQPFLVERVLNFMTEPEHVNSDNYARGLVAAYAIVYIGLAVRIPLTRTFCIGSHITHFDHPRYPLPCINTKTAVSSPWSGGAWLRLSSTRHCE
jgi:hypothetical protein